MHILCPHCHNPIEVVHLSGREEVACPSCGSSFHLESNPTTTLAPGGQRLGKFEVLDTVGQGAFGTVYKAHDAELDRIVAIKVPRAGNLAGPQELDRLLREARSVAQLRHPGIVSIHEVGQSDGLFYLVSEFVQGLTLTDLLSARRPGFRETAELIATVAEALQYAHEHGVVHRDIKPSNIMIGDDGKPYIMDFGLAKRDAGEITMTIEGQVLGTPAYMSPEQAGGESHNVDGRSDVYSLGVVLYQLLTGELPFRGTKRMLLHQVLHDEPKAPRSLNDRIPRDLQTICLKAMAKGPGGRYSKAGELAADLRRYLAGEPIHARPVGRWERGRRWLRRHPLQAALGAMTTLALAALAVSLVSVGYSQQLGEAYDQEAEARGRAEQAGREASLAEGRATKARGEVEKALGDVRQSRDETKVALDLANTHAYFHRIAMADSALHENNVERARGLLDACPKELRHWEWGHLMQQCSAPLASFQGGHKGEIFSKIRISPDGRYLAWNNVFGAVTVAEAETGKPIWSREPPTGPIERLGMAISPDGQMLACEGKGGTIEVRKLSDGKLQQSVPMHEQDGRSGNRAGTTALTFAPDSKKLAVAWGNWIGLIDIEHGVYLHTYPGRFFRVVDLHFHPDGKSFVSAHWDHHAWIWVVEGGPPKRTILCNQGPLFTAHFNPRGTLLATGGLDGSIRLWNAADGQPVTTIPAHDFTVRRIAFRPDGLGLASCSSDGTVQTFSLIRPNPRGVVYRGHIGIVTDVSFHPEGDRLYSTGMDGTVKVWDATRPPVGQSAVGKGNINHIRARFLPGSQQIVAAGISEVFQVRDVATLSVVRTLRPIPKGGSVGFVVAAPKVIAIHPSGKKVALRALGMPLEVREVSTGKLLFAIPEAGGNM